MLHVMNFTFKDKKGHVQNCVSHCAINKLFSPDWPIKLLSLLLSLNFDLAAIQFHDRSIKVQGTIAGGQNLNPGPTEH